MTQQFGSHQTHALSYIFYKSAWR